MADEHEKHTGAQASAEGKTSKVKPKSKIKTQRLLEKAQTRKWLLYGGAACLVIWLVASKAVSERTRPNTAPPPPEFVDTSPDTSRGEEITIARLQRQLQDANEAMAEQRERQQERDEAFMRQLEELQSNMREDREQMRTTISSLEDRLSEARGEGAGASGVSFGTGGPSRDRNGASDPADYLRPPRVEDRGVVPPPPLARDDSPARGSLPPRQQSTSGGSSTIPPQVPYIQEPEQPRDPIVLTGSGGESNARILRNEDASSDDDGDQEGPPKAGFLPMGSFSDIAMLTGADFGAAERTRNNPQPVLFRIQNDAFLPGSARYRLSDCFGMGGGYGDLSSERAHINVTRISCVDTQTGMMLEASINGYIVDSDGRLGLRGNVERRSGALLGKAMLAGFAEGASSLASVAAQGTQQTVTGSGVVTSVDPSRVGEVGLYGGAGRAMEILAEQYIAEAESMFPVIEIPSGRRGTFVVQEGQRLEWEAYELAEAMPTQE